MLTKKTLTSGRIVLDSAHFKMSLRDANVVIIETSRTVVRAGLGLHDLLKIPTVVCMTQSMYPICLG